MTGQPSTLARLRFRAGTAKRRLVGWKPYPDVVVPACALCGSDHRTNVGTRVAFDMRYTNVLCVDCGLVYLCPRPTEAAFDDFYARLYPRLYGSGGADEISSERGTAVAEFLAGSLDLSAQTGLFDVGCGGGALLRSVARVPAFDHVRLGGCDPGWPGEERTLVHEGSREIEIFGVAVQRLSARLAEYSIFVLYDVLEHLLLPGTFLAALHEEAPPGAVLFVSTNALDNWREIPPGGWETYYLRLAHTYTFTKRTLDALLRGTGWRPIATADAAKGDQWVVAERSAPEPAALLPAPEHAREVVAMIAAYRARSRVSGG